MKERNRSAAIYTDLCDVFPAGVNSPVRAFKEIGILPIVASTGKGDLFWDADDNAYIDFCCSWGSLILGHSPDAVMEKAIHQMSQGTSFGITTPYEERLARKIRNHYPSMEKIRFVSSGTEASMSAIRLARGFTGRSTILKFDGNYHGHIDSLLVRAGSGATLLDQKPSSLGIPEDFIKYTVSLPYNDTAACREFLRSASDLAAVIIEPVAGNMGVVSATQEFLEMLREETEKIGALLIFDEVITGFRVGLNGVQGEYNISPDLTCLAKIIGGGFPAAAFGGSKEIMDFLAPSGSVYQAGTLSGNPIAMIAGYHTLEEIEKEGFYEDLEEKTNFILQPIREHIQKNNLKISINQRRSMFTIFFGIENPTCQNEVFQADAKLFQKFFLYLLEKGIYFSPSMYEANFVCKAHTVEHLVKTRDAILDFMRML